MPEITLGPVRSSKLLDRPMQLHLDITFTCDSKEQEFKRMCSQAGLAAIQIRDKLARTAITITHSKEGKGHETTNKWIINIPVEPGDDTTQLIDLVQNIAHQALFPEVESKPEVAKTAATQQDDSDTLFKKVLEFKPFLDSARFLELAQLIMEKAYYNDNTFTVAQCTRDFFASFGALFSKQLAEFSEVYNSLEMLEKFLKAHQNQTELREQVRDQIDLIRELGKILVSAGVLGNKTIAAISEEDLSQAYQGLCNFAAKAQYRPSEHALLLAKIKDTTAQVVVLGIGTHGSAEQTKPPFVKDLFGTVLICNFDQAEPYAMAKKKMLELSVHGVLVDLPLHNRFFPLLNTRQYFERAKNLLTFISSAGSENPNKDLAIREIIKLHDALLANRERNNLRTAQALQPLLQAVQAPFWDAQLQQGKDTRAEYLQTMLAKKVQNPDFKLVILYCCHAHYPQVLKELAEQLIAGGFKLGKDLQLLHAYVDQGPVLVYNDIAEIPEWSKPLEAAFLPGGEIYTPKDTEAFCALHNAKYYDTMKEVVFNLGTAPVVRPKLA